jgi:restriction system protein
MGRVSMERGRLIEQLLGIIAHKSGLKIDRDQLSEIAGDDYSYIFDGLDDEFISIRSESIQQIVSSVLYSLGNISDLDADIPGFSYYRNIKDDSRKVEIFQKILRDVVIYLPIMMEEATKKGTKALDPTILVNKVMSDFNDVEVLDVLKTILDGFLMAGHMSMTSPSRLIDWKDTKELKELFDSESLSTHYGNFIDQRFIDYLHRNFTRIDNMNWRKFEGLVGEFFSREGYYVEIGPGRNDGSIDARVWPKEDDKTNPPLILIQCKRQKQKVEKVVVKALWADIQDEKAKSGLIVTTSSLSPGAADVCTVRSYPINQVARNGLKEWIAKMRSSQD